MSREPEDQWDEAETPEDEEFAPPPLGEVLGENELTVILPDEEGLGSGDELAATILPEEEEGFGSGDELAVTDNLEMTDSFEATDTVSLDPEDTEEVFVLLPDAEESEIPMVETEEVTDEFGDLVDDNTEVVSATEVGLRHENPLEPGDTEPMGYDDAVEEDFVADEPTDFDLEEATEPVHLEDLDDLASDVEDDLFHDGGARGRLESDEEEDFDIESFEDDVVERPRRGRRSGSPLKKIFVGMAALALLSAAGFYFFPEQIRPYLEQVGLGEFLPGGDAVATTSGGDVNPPDGGSGETPTPDVDPVTPPDTLAQQSRETFHGKFLQSIELGFAGEASR